jgi:energy-coupling factor transporter transmembrane protein EcfT
MKFIYQFVSRRSFLHRLDPRTKLLLVALTLVVCFLTSSPWLVFAAAILAIWIFGRTSPLQYWPVLIMMAPLVTAVFLVHRSREGLEVGFRLAAMGITFLGFSMTTDPFDLGIALFYAGIPYRVSFMIAFALRFFPLLHEEMSIIRNALRARGYQGPGTVALTALPLGLGALRRSQKIALAMELRGFSYAEEMKTQRTILKDIRMRPPDYVAIAVGVSICIAVAIYR